MSDDANETVRLNFSAIMFGLIAVVIGFDLLLDGRDGVGFLHLALEGSVFLTALVGMVFMMRRFTRISGDLLLAREDAERWQAEHNAVIQGLSAAIRIQFAAWRLTEAETEIGFLLLKGLSHQEIAKLRNTSERTVREQARALYRKGRVTGRSELSAFFLEDLL